MSDLVEKQAHNSCATLSDLIVLSRFVAYHADDGGDKDAAPSCLRLVAMGCEQLRAQMEDIEHHSMQAQRDNGRYIHLESSR